MEKMAENLKEKAEHLDQMSDSTNMALAEMRLQFETMMEMQRQERADMAKLHSENVDKVRRSYSYIIIALSLTLSSLIFAVIACTILILN